MSLPGIKYAILVIVMYPFALFPREKTLLNFHDAYHIFNSIGNVLGKAEILNLIGNIYNNWSEFERALDYYEGSIELRKSEGEENLVASTMNDIGFIYFQFGEYNKALDFYLNAARIKHEYNNEFFSLGDIYSNIGDVYFHKKDYEKALRKYLLALEYRKKASDIRGISSSLNNIGRMYMDMGQLEKAENYIQQSLLIKTPETDLRNYEDLSKLYEKKHKYDSALYYHKLFFSLSDSLFNIQRHLQMAELEVKYEMDFNKREVDLLKQKAEIQDLKLNKHRLIIIISSGTGVLIIISIILLNVMHDQILRRKQSILEHKLLRSQLNPHFIFNILGAIQNYILKNKSIEAGKYISEFASLMRAILNNSNKEFIDLQSEIDFLKNYILLQQLRFSNSFDFQIDVSPEIDPESTEIPPMLLQPFIENSIEHGFKGKKERGILDLNFFTENENMVIQLKDNGIGRDAAMRSTLRKHEPVAIEITNKRIGILNKMGKKHYRFQIIDLKSEEGFPLGTEVIFTLPLLINS